MLVLPPNIETSKHNSIRVWGSFAASNTPQVSIANPRTVVKRNSLHSASASGRKLHIRSFRYPLKIKADTLILEGRRREQSALFVTLDENGAMRASSDTSASLSIENIVFNRIKKTPIRAQKPR
ncbi:MAG: hypothetical protein K6G66_05435 [Oscillospiraceae bacterium]|nr:hypothetical protein [Oscillospiraceae bacterium]